MESSNWLKLQRSSVVKHFHGDKSYIISIYSKHYFAIDFISKFFNGPPARNRSILYVSYMYTNVCTWHYIDSPLYIGTYKIHSIEC